MTAGIGACHILSVAVFGTMHGTLGDIVPVTSPFGLVLVAIVSWIFAVTAGLIVGLPVFICITAIGELFRWHSLSYYVLATVFAVLLNTPLFALVAPPIFFQATAESSFLEKWIAVTPLMLFSAAFGGAIYWWKAGHLPETRVETEETSSFRP
jgi:MFS superfamily sulfate permease-like transporter